MDDTTLPLLVEGGGEGRGMRILIAEDERDTLMTLGILLRTEKYEVLMLDDGRDVVSEVQRFQPHAVILDIGMPGRTGHEVAMDVREACGASCPVLIALTGHTSEADVMRSRQSGFHHHVGKPFDPVRLLDLLAGVRAEAPGI